MKNMTLYRMEVGSTDGVEVRNIVGAIANETGLRSRFIGQIRIHPDYSTVELPDDLPRNMIEHLKRTFVGHKPMKISRVRSEGPFRAEAGEEASPRPKKVKSGKPKAGKPKAPKSKKPKKTAGKTKTSKAGKPKGKS